MTNLELLYEIADKILNKQNELYRLLVDKNIDNQSLEHKNIFNELKILVIKENAFISSLKIEDVDICIGDLKTLLENNFELTEENDITSFDGLEEFIRKLITNIDDVESIYDADVLLRVFDRLKSRSYIKCGEGVRMKINIDTEAINYDVWIWDAIMSELNLTVLKKIKDAIYSLVPSRKEENKFISDLKFNLECLKLKVLFGNFSSEIKAICANNDLDKIKVKDLNNFMKLDNLALDDLNDFLLEEAKKHIDTLADITYLVYSPGSVFDFKEEVTSFEVLVSHMDLETLKSIYDYSTKLTNNENNPCMSGINNFIKAKIKRKSN